MSLFNVPIASAGLIYGAYASFKGDQNQRNENGLKFFILFALYYVFAECAVDLMLAALLPFYGVLKLAILVAICWPNENLQNFMFDLISPSFAKYEAKLSRALSSLRGFGAFKISAGARRVSVGIYRNVLRYVPNGELKQLEGAFGGLCTAIKNENTRRLQESFQMVLAKGEVAPAIPPAVVLVGNKPLPQPAAVDIMQNLQAAPPSQPLQVPVVPAAAAVPSVPLYMSAAPDRSDLAVAAAARPLVSLVSGGLGGKLSAVAEADEGTGGATEEPEDQATSAAVSLVESVTLRRSARKAARGNRNPGRFSIL